MNILKCQKNQAIPKEHREKWERGETIHWRIYEQNTNHILLNKKVNISQLWRLSENYLKNNKKGKESIIYPALFIWRISQGNQIGEKEFSLYKNILVNN